MIREDFLNFRQQGVDFHGQGDRVGNPNKKCQIESKVVKAGGWTSETHYLII